LPRVFEKIPNKPTTLGHMVEHTSVDNKPSKHDYKGNALSM
jgi:hypothetical protein